MPQACLLTLRLLQVPKAAVLDRATPAPNSNGQTEAAKPQPALDFDQQLPDMSKASPQHATSRCSAVWCLHPEAVHASMWAHLFTLTRPSVFSNVCSPIYSFNYKAGSSYVTATLAQ